MDAQPQSSNGGGNGRRRNGRNRRRSRKSNNNNNQQGGQQATQGQQQGNGQNGQQRNGKQNNRSRNQNRNRKRKGNSEPRVADMSPSPVPQTDVKMSVPAAKPHAGARTSSTTLSELTDQSFASLGISAPSLHGLNQVMGYINMTKVQYASIPVALTGVDVLAKARTGTGKTLAFLIPAVERMVKSMQGKKPSPDINTLIISPTRELARQIEAEARLLLSKHQQFRLMCVYGGTNVSTDVKKMTQRTPHVLVATPGRLNDLLDSRGLKHLAARLQCLILDEADQLLDMGFRPAILRTLQMLPPAELRQTLLFSATMPADVKSIAALAMKPKYAFVDTVPDQKQTHQVPQEMVVCSLQDHVAQLVGIIQTAMQVVDHKIMVFFTTARLTQFYAELFNLMGIPVMEIHSRKSQAHRTRTSKKFRETACGIIFSSDVSARGMDYPDVSTVVQVGMPSDRAQYVHRLGRTARAGKGGNGIVLLCDFEAQRFRSLTKGLPIKSVPGVTAEQVEQYQQMIRPSMSRMKDQTSASGYRAWLGYYNTWCKKLNWSKAKLVQVANSFACDVIGLSEPPTLMKRTVGKMGLRGVPGLNIEASGNNKKQRFPQQRQQQQSSQRQSYNNNNNNHNNNNNYNNNNMQWQNQPSGQQRNFAPFRGDVRQQHNASSSSSSAAYPQLQDTRSSAPRQQQRGGGRGRGPMRRAPPRGYQQQQQQQQFHGAYGGGW